MIFVPGAGRGGCASYLPWNNSKSNDSDTRGDILDELQLARDAEKFASTAVQAIGTGDEILSVLQGEVATAQPGDGPVGLGSDSATTCHIVGFRNPANGRTCLAHLDSADKVSEALESMLCLVSSDEGVPLDTYLVGGYLGRSCAEDMSSSLISELHASPRTFRVVLACISRLNSARSEAVGGGSTAPPLPPPPPSRGCSAVVTPWSGGSLGGGISVAEGGNGSSGGSSSGINEKRNILPNTGDAGLATEGSRCPQAGVGQASAGATSGAHSEHDDGQQPVNAGRRGDGVDWLPRRTGLAINLASGEPFPVRFEGAGRGPGWEVRYSRTFAGDWKPLLSDIYEPRLDTIVVTPFPLWVNSFAMLRLLSLSDRELLAVTSTSPEAEAESFVADVRSCIAYVLNRIGPDGQGWLENVFGGGDGAPLVYPRVAVTAAAAAAVVEPD